MYAFAGGRKRLQEERCSSLVGGDHSSALASADAGR
jgi:hypothetical protein